MASLISTVTHSALLNLFETAQREIIYAAPGLPTAVAEALISSRRKGVNIRVIIDPAETSFRNGYGELEAIKRLQKDGCELLEVPGNRISFLLTDDSGYLLFNQSLALEEQGHGTNAVQIDAVQQQQLLLHFFPPRDLFEATQRIQHLQKAIERTSVNMSRLTAEVDSQVGKTGAQTLNPIAFAEVTESLTNNPPVHPDRRRQTMVYTSKFQFVELEFKGANLGLKRVIIPKDVLPVRDKRLKDALETKLKILENQKDLPESWLKLKDEVDNVREMYLVKIASANKNVLDLTKKLEFTKAIKELENNVNNTKQELAVFLKKTFIQTQERFVQTLVQFFAANPPDDLLLFKDDKNYPDFADDYANGIVRQIKFPNLTTEINNVTFTVRYFDVTWEDLNSEKFLEELQAKKLITDKDFDQLRKTEQMFKSKGI
ncbi:hypothetical protein [Spirosoma lituiforme]